MPEIIEITEFNDPRVDVYRNVRDADLRGRDDLFMAESELVLRRLLKLPHRVHSALLSVEKFNRLRDALQALDQATPVYVCSLRLMHEIAAFHIHRGVLAAGYRLEPNQLTIDAALAHLQSADSSQPVTLLLAEGITNVDNMGGLFRNAAAFGVNGIVLDRACCDPLYRKAIRVSMGHALSVPYAIADDWLVTIEKLKRDWNLRIVAAEAHPRAVPLWQMSESSRIGLLFGSEGHGVDERTLDACDQLCWVPMAGNVPSLNVATASAVFLYERRRQVNRRS